MAPSTSEVFTLAEVAAFLRVAERTIYRLAGARKIPAFKVGGKWRFAKTEIDQWIKQQAEAAKGARQRRPVKRK